MLIPWTLGYFLIFVGIILLGLVIYLHKITSSTNKFMPGNIWESQDHEIVIIENRCPESPLIIRCSSNGVNFSTDTKGDRGFIPASVTFHKHIGTIKTHPEYLL